jgi:hypothetical protein
MTFGEDMGAMASELVKDFSEEIGMSIYKHPTGEVYDPVTGVNTQSFDDHSAYISFTDVESSEAKDRTYIKNHELAIVAGNDIPVVPVEGGLIQKPTGTVHRIVAIDGDQYGAGWFLDIKKKPDA